MQDNGYWNSLEDQHRDIFREIDAGELDEAYLIKHASDYGKRAEIQLLRLLQAMLARLINLIARAARPKQVVKPVKTISHSTAR